MIESKNQADEEITKELDGQEEVIDQVEPLSSGQERYLNENLLYLQISLLISSSLVILLLISPKSSFMALYSALLSIAAPLISTSVVISISSKIRIKEIEYIILNSGIGVLGSYFCGLFLWKTNFLPPSYLVLASFPSLYYYLISFSLFILGILSLIVFLKSIYEWIIHKKWLSK
jgi:hypothetical protein